MRCGHFVVMLYVVVMLFGVVMLYVVVKLYVVIMLWSRCMLWSCCDQNAAVMSSSGSILVSNQGTESSMRASKPIFEQMSKAGERAECSTQS
jgi:hypothetical protein